MPGGALHFPAFGPVLIGVTGKQYFDIFEAKEKEVIVDCGACDGTTELEIAHWTDFSYKKIFAFEPEKDNCKKCKLFYEKNKLSNVELIEKGTWSKEDVLLFNKGTDGMNAGGSLQSYGTEKVFVTSIDEVVGEEKVTFIKMDVEGAELESLKGAAKTIQKDTPRLAICIYHKESDLWEIPQYILQLNKNYRFYIRHYTSYFYETVLYAEVV